MGQKGNKRGKMQWNNYKCDGQMSIFDFLGDILKKPTPKCQLANECEAYPHGCGGTIEPCRWGGPYKWSCNNRTKT